MANQIIFFFGAGASKGATHIMPYCPPLMYKLYDELARYAPEDWGPSSPMGSYADQSRDRFEETFLKVVLNIGKNGPPTSSDSLTLLEKQRLVARYFSEFFLDSSNMDYYSKLLASLNAASLIPDCFFASLNYDYLFEQAGDRLGLRVDYLCDESKFIRIAKLHGSCNFIKKISRSERALLASPGFYYESGFEIDFVPETLKEKLSSPDYFPVISQVSPGKEQILAPAKIQKIRNAWAQALSSASYLAIIGVSYNQNDIHVIEPIRDTQAKIGYIGGDNNFEKWKAENKNFKHIGQKLEKGFECLIHWLGI